MYQNEINRITWNITRYDNKIKKRIKEDEKGIDEVKIETTLTKTYKIHIRDSSEHNQCHTESNKQFKR